MPDDARKPSRFRPDTYFTGKVAFPGQAPLPPELAKPTIRDPGQLDLVTHLEKLKKPRRRKKT